MSKHIWQIRSKSRKSEEKKYKIKNRKNCKVAVSKSHYKVAVNKSRTHTLDKYARGSGTGSSMIKELLKKKKKKSSQSKPK